MRIAMILRRLNVKGGTQRQALSLGRELLRRGHKVDLYTLDLDRERCYPDLLALFPRIHEISPEAHAQAERLPTLARFLPSPLIALIRENRLARALAREIPADYDLLNPHDQVAYKIAYYYKTKNTTRSNIQHRVLNKNVEHSVLNSMPSIWNMNDLPLKMWAYDHRRGQEETFRQPWHRLLAYRLFDTYDVKKFIRRQDAIVVVDFFNRDLVRHYMGLKAFTVRSGPDFEHFPFREHEPPKNRSVRVLTSGIFLPHRRYEDAIIGTSILRSRGYDATLTILGLRENDPSYNAKLVALTRESGIEQYVTFTGSVSEERLIALYHTHHIYTFQHHLQSDGLSPFEAAACGMPIVVSKTAGCHELLTDGENALLIEPKNPEDWAQKIAALTDDPALYRRLATAANSFVRANFSWEKYADGFLQVVTEVQTSGAQVRL
ncbi:MAG: glycosyltransferase family 4 protein [bacterium]|nr:glycosyltransferase family 4 protein [bacterium]MDZ4285042.1 glycosyltransferase family 4 protein [Patescibacteria group bacterium]